MMSTNPIDEAIAHLGAALIVANETDEPIIMEHVRAAHELLGPLHSAKVGGPTSDAAKYARVFRAASEGVMYPFHGSPQENAARQQAMLASGRTSWSSGRSYSDASYDHARSMQGAFSAIADVFEAIIKAEAAPLPFGSATSCDDVPV